MISVTNEMKFREALVWFFNFYVWNHERVQKLSFSSESRFVTQEVVLLVFLRYLFGFSFSSNFFWPCIVAWPFGWSKADWTISWICQDVTPNCKFWIFGMMQYWMCLLLEELRKQIMLT